MESSNIHLLQEGLIVHLPTPMNHFTWEIKIDADVSIFETIISEIKHFNRSSELLQAEPDTMSAR